MKKIYTCALNERTCNVPSLIKLMYLKFATTVCFIFVFTDIYVLITKAFGLPKPSLFCNVQRDVASLPSYSKLNSKCNCWNSHMLPHLLLIGSC